MSSLRGKVVWITGASSGIGEALVYAFASQGARLILSSRRKEELERVKGNCRPPGKLK
jgi:NADP-dependent 3-hydroxy acid dehydrogenase YdfG